MAEQVAPEDEIPVISPPVAETAEEEAEKQQHELVAVPNAVEDVANAEVPDTAALALGVGGKKKRLCRYPGCQRVIKSQGHCQRHGAKAKRCKVEGCDKQAQGTHDGMCKRHWKAIHFPDTSAQKPDVAPPPPEGESVYDGVLPQSISYRPSLLHNKQALMEAAAKNPTDDPPPPPGGVSVMPLVAYLREGASRELGWHRNAERRARGLFPVSSLASQLEPWERQLVSDLDLCFHS